MRYILKSFLIAGENCAVIKTGSSLKSAFLCSIYIIRPILFLAFSRTCGLSHMATIILKVHNCFISTTRAVQCYVNKVSRIVTAKERCRILMHGWKLRINCST